METSLIVIILIVLSIIAAVTYFVFLKKQNGDSSSPSFIPSSPEESLLEKVIIKKQSEDPSITQSSFYKLSSIYVSPSPTFEITTVTPSPSPTPSVIIENTYSYTEIITMANDSNTFIEDVNDPRNRNFEKYDSIFQDVIDDLFELSGCGVQKKNIPLSRMWGLIVTTKLTNGQSGLIMFLPLLIRIASKNQTIDPDKFRRRINDFWAAIFFIQSADRMNITSYNKKTKQVTFKDRYTPIRINLIDNTTSLDVFRDALTREWFDSLTEIEPFIKVSKYLDNYPVCRVFTL